jgi:hypothetical protein
MSGTADPPPPPTTIDRTLLAGFPSAGLLAAMQLELFTPLGHGPMTADELAATLGVSARRLAPLLYLLVHAGLLRQDGDRFANTEEAQHYLVKGGASYLGGGHELFSDLYRAAFQTAASIRADRPQAKHDFAAMSEQELGAFFRGLHGLAVVQGRQLARERDFGRFRRLIDVGGGSGGAAIGACEVCPELRAVVADLPSVVPFTRRFIDEAGLAGRISAEIVDITAVPPSSSYEVAILRNVLQVLPAEEARRTVLNVGRALEPGGELYIIGQCLNDTRLSPPETVAFNLVFLNIYDDGQAYTFAEHRAWLEEAGFTDVERTMLQRGLSRISARKRD